MRNRTVILLGALLLASTGLTAQGQQQPQTNGQAAGQTTQTTVAVTPASSFTPKLGWIDFGYRGDSVSGDEARYNRYRDLRDGAALNAFQLKKETEANYFFARAENVGYRDQRYSANYQSIGHLKASFDWIQVPLYLSKGTVSLYSDQGNGRLDIADTTQATIQAAAVLGTAARDKAIENALAVGRETDIRSRRDLAAFNLVYSMNRDIDLKLQVKNTRRTGSQVMSFGFGTSPGLLPSVELPAPTDDRTTDVRGVAEFANARGMFAVGWDSSWYNQNIPFVKFDNPLRAIDANNGPSVGQAAWWPTNSAFNVNVNGSYKLAKRTRASAAFSVGQWTQDEALPPPTVNTALVAPPLERASAETQADIKTMLFGFNSRPTDALLFTARYRYYDYDNKTPHFTATNAVIGDWTVGTQIHEIEPSSFLRKTLDLDAAFTPFEYFTFGAGYTREDGERTFRIYEKTEDNVYRLTADAFSNQYFSVRGKYEYSERRGSGFEEHLLEEVGEQPDMRHYDIADRDRSRLTALFTVTPNSYFSINAAVGNGDDDYIDSGFGLRDAKNNNWSAGIDCAPGSVVSFGASYAWDKYQANTKHRTAVPPGTSSGPNEFYDERRDWTTDQDDEVKTTSVYLDLTKALPKTDMRFAYDLSDGAATYVYATRPDAPRTTVPNVESAVPIPLALPPVNNRLTTGRFDINHYIRPNVAIGVVYHYEEYKVDDFGMDTGTIDRLDPKSAATGLLANTIYAGYLYRPYTAHTWWLKMTYLW
jgi:MtrB/PioB family decaheme-associated outer membrane protein